MRFVIRWPDGASTTAYSPSRAIREHLRAGQPYEIEEFVARCRAGLHAASRRVEERYGHPCSIAAGTLAAIEARASALAADPAGSIVVEQFIPASTYEVER